MQRDAPISIPRALAAGLLALLAAACGEPRSVEVLDEEPGSHLAGKDVNEPIPGRPGHYRKLILTGPYPLPKQTINMHAEPFRIGLFRRREKVWVTSWESNTEDQQGNREPDDIHCHAFLTDVRTVQEDSQVFTGLYTDGFTPVMALPEGFAIPISAGARMYFAPMFNNRRPTKRTSRMRLIINFVPESERTREYRPLHSYTMRVAPYDFYFIDPGKVDRKTRVVEMPFEGRVHAIGGHIHPYGEYIELARERTHEVLFTARLKKKDGLLEHQRLDTYSSKEGFYVRRGEPLRVTGVYNNTTDEKIDAMAGLFLLYDPDGEPDA